MTLHISSVFTYDEDAGNYIQAVETADGQALESATRKAINNFVIGCKQDGIWDAIKASCILSGARTLNGALVPLVGTAPTNYNFVSGDYDRKTGLVGDGSTKYLDSNRLNNADPQDSKHMSLIVSSLPTSGSGQYPRLIAGPIVGSGVSYIIRNQNNGDLLFAVNSGSGTRSAAAGFVGVSRAASGSFNTRINSSNAVFNQASSAPSVGNIAVFTEGGTVPRFYSNARLAFYSIGESLDLAKLDGRVTDLINKFAQVIP